jgi:hypothetical protein
MPRNKEILEKSDIFLKYASSKLTVIYAKEQFPSEVVKTLMLCGPTPRNNNVISWRKEAIETLEKLGFDGHVFCPEERNGTFQGDYDDQIKWETEALNRADVIVFWVPRNMKTLPGLTTNVEFGAWANSGKVILGFPENAENIRYLTILLKQTKSLYLIL